MRLKRNIVAVAMAITIFATGCQKAPEESVVKNKNLDKMIQQAKETGDKDSNPESIAREYNEYKKKIKNEKLSVNVDIDAKVDIPKVKKMSVIKVKQKKITQQFVDDLLNALNLKQTLYDGCITKVNTKEELEKSIQDAKKELEQLKKENEEEVIINEQKMVLDELKEEYKTAPKNIDWNKYKSDLKITPVKKLYERNTKDKFYSWEYGLNKTGDVLYAVSNENEKLKSSLYVQNNEEYGNGLRFYRTTRGFGWIFSVGFSQWRGNLETNNGMWPTNRKIQSSDTVFDFDADSGFEDELVESKDEPATLSENKAKQTAEKFLKDVGLTDYKLDKSGFYYELIPNDEKHSEDETYYRKIYYLRYLRSIDGVAVENGNTGKFTDENTGGDYTKNEWNGESIDICVNDAGIVTFNLNSPIETKDTVVKESKLKSFSSIKKTFEKMIVTSNAQLDNGDGFIDSININVKKVVLRYMRISEANDFQSGLLVPVWDFIGTKKYKYNTKSNDENGENEESLMTINAIDGTVIDKQLGY